MNQYSLDIDSISWHRIITTYGTAKEFPQYFKILWDMDKMPAIYQNLINLVPIYYIVRGFRESLLYGVPFYVHQKDMIVSWSIVIVLFIFGCYLQDKFRNRFRDLI